MMTDRDVASFGNWLKYLWREEKGFLIAYTLASVMFATFVGVFTFCLLTSIR